MFKILSICKGGGYRYCRTEPPHPNRNSKGLYPLHRVLKENELGRLLTSNEVVHHDDENKNNDSIDNLILLSNAEHSKLHRPSKEKLQLLCECGMLFFIKPYEAQVRKQRNKSGKVFCSRSCGTRYRNK